jgi:hypothetical protein
MNASRAPALVEHVPRVRRAGQVRSRREMVCAPPLRAVGLALPAPKADSRTELDGPMGPEKNFDQAISAMSGAAGELFPEWAPSFHETTAPNRAENMRESRHAP